MEHYVTLFDRFFLPQGLALYSSMLRHIECFTLWIICLDKDSSLALHKLSLANIKILELDALETKDLLLVKPLRTKAEYCWTLTPFAPKFVFDADPMIDRVTYIDADFWFNGNPKKIFDDFSASGKAIFITEHVFAPENDKSSICGNYCVQFMIFDRRGEVVRKWWEDRCIEWCYNRHEDGKFGDQKYLDCWPHLFSDLVYVLPDYELLWAPWNSTNVEFEDVLACHFHELRILNRHYLCLGGYSLPKEIIKNFYLPYFRDLRHASVSMDRVGLPTLPQQTFGFLNKIKLVFSLFLPSFSRIFFARKSYSRW